MRSRERPLPSLSLSHSLSLSLSLSLCLSRRDVCYFRAAVSWIEHVNYSIAIGRKEISFQS